VKLDLNELLQSMKVLPLSDAAAAAK
jgi:hypothetical protein